MYFVFLVKDKNEAIVRRRFFVDELEYQRT
jgi:hypothetical protein